LSPGRIKGVIAQAQACVAIPLHATIFAVSAGVPVAALAYAPKVTAFLQEVGKTRFTVSRVEDIPDLVQTAMAEKISMEQDATLLAYKERVKKNFLALERLLTPSEGVQQTAQTLSPCEA
jgi:polysaccharide pyruvyl transferase WcaK-like protein